MKREARALKQTVDHANKKYFDRVGQQLFFRQVLERV
jgi:hypothetical protein